jgi:hypothetical protein
MRQPREYWRNFQNCQFYLAIDELARFTINDLCYITLLGRTNLGIGSFDGYSEGGRRFDLFEMRFEDDVDLYRRERSSAHQVCELQRSGRVHREFD